MKKLTYHGPGHILAVPGLFTLSRGGSEVVDDVLAEQLLAANPHLHLEVGDVDAAGPPRAGSGSSKAAWLAYAALLGIDTDGMTRDGIIAAVDEHQSDPSARVLSRDEVGAAEDPADHIPDLEPAAQ